MTDEALLAAVRITAEARRDRAALDAALKAKLAAFQESNADLMQQRQLAAQRVEVAEGALREYALEVGLTLDTNTPCPGVVLKLKTEVAILDETEALDWAKRTGLCLTLDRKGLETIAVKGGASLPFVRVTTAKTATLATDLDKALATADVTAPTPAPEGVA